MPKQVVKGAALCGDGSLFAGRETYGKPGNSEAWDVLTLDRVNRSWRVVGNVPKSTWGWLYGCEGGKLVTCSRTSPAQALNPDFWTPLVR